MAASILVALTGATVAITGEAPRAQVAPEETPQPVFTLRVIPAGGGRISDGHRIECGLGAHRCVARYALGTRVELSARVEPGRRFLGWSVWECPGRERTCAVVVDQNRVVTAAMDPVRLTVVKRGDGAITSDPPGLECGTGCEGATASYPSGTVVHLRATPATSGLTATWRGRCRRVVDLRCTIRVVDDTTLTATFHAPVPGPGPSGGGDFTVPITVVKAGAGPGVIVVGAPGGGGRGIRCPSTCRADGYGLSSRMRIAALAQPGGAFVRWRNGCRPATRRRCLVDALTHTSMRGTFRRRP